MKKPLILFFKCISSKKVYIQFIQVQSNTCDVYCHLLHNVQDDYSLHTAYWTTSCFCLTYIQTKRTRDKAHKMSLLAMELNSQHSLEYWHGALCQGQYNNTYPAFPDLYFHKICKKYKVSPKGNNVYIHFSTFK